MSSASQVSEVPKEPHWAIITFGRVWNSYDEDYSDIGPTRYEIFLTEDEWMAEIQRREESRSVVRDYVAMKVFPATVKASVKVNVEVT